MLTLLSLGNSAPIALPYEPETHGDMPAWQYAKTVIAPTAGFVLTDDGKTLAERVKGANGLWFNFENRFRPVKDFVDETRILRYVLPLGPSFGTYRGNACPDGGNMECAICLEASFDMSLSCLHRFHASCLARSGRPTCPMCRQAIARDDFDNMRRLAAR